jgi:hypothetical protein
MGENRGYRDLLAQQRIGGYFQTLEDLENYIRFLSFDVVVSQDCNRGWYAVPVSAVDGDGARGVTTSSSP